MARFFKVQSTEFKVHPSPLMLRRDKNFVRCAQIYLLDCRAALRLLAMTKERTRYSKTILLCHFVTNKKPAVGRFFIIWNYFGLAVAGAHSAYWLHFEFLCLTGLNISETRCDPESV